MKIDVLCNDGSPLGVTSATVWGDDPKQIGVGGAELALITMCETWHKRGFDVTLYNNPRSPEKSVFQQRAIAEFEPSDNRDILVVFRSPNEKAVPAKGMKVWWSTDQHTVGNFKHFSEFVDKIVCISPYHSEYFKSRYGIENSIVIDLPVRLYDYSHLTVHKIKNRFLFSSVPDRGLNNLYRMWSAVQREVPDASLIITSDYRLWGTGAPMNERHRVNWLNTGNVEFVGAVKREELIKYQLTSEIMLYPCTYEELFCIAVAEAQACGVLPITTNIGALQTTNMYKRIPVDANDPRNDKLFIDAVVETLSDMAKLREDSMDIYHKSVDRFHPDKISDLWEKVVFNE